MKEAFKARIVKKCEQFGMFRASLSCSHGKDAFLFLGAGHSCWNWVLCPRWVDLWFVGTFWCVCDRGFERLQVISFWVESGVLFLLQRSGIIRLITGQLSALPAKNASRLPRSSHCRRDLIFGSSRKLTRGWKVGDCLCEWASESLLAAFTLEGQSGMCED